jgi:pimeloyl-ACP methyl ester carboxylesterase
MSSPAWSCSHSLSVGQCWPCCRYGSLTNLSGGPLRQPCSWESPVGSCFLAALTLASVGTGYETVGESVDTTAYPMPGELINVGGRRLHLRCTGSGSPTVVLEPGLGEASSAMAWIAPAVARDSRVCVYDRAGRGWSDAADGPLDSAQTAADLHTLLDRAHIPGPYVLAGHSFGGLYILTFAATYPDEVAGMVLLDSTAPAAAPAPSTTKPGSYDFLGRISALLPAVAHLGGARLVGQFSYGSLLPRARDEARARSASASYVGSYINEFREGRRRCSRPHLLLTWPGKPLIVVTAGREHDGAWLAPPCCGQRHTRLASSRRN